MRRLLAAALAAAAAALVPRTAQAGSPGGTQIGPSVMLLGSFDWLTEPATDGSPWSRCIEMVRTSRSVGSDRVHFVPTAHWIGGDEGVEDLCYMHGKDGTHVCRAIGQEDISGFRDGLTECFKEAMNAGLHISLAPHLDDGSGNGAWRNGLLLRPSQTYGRHSYAQIMLEPLADALRAAMAQTGRWDTNVWFSMQGEMSATIMRFPRDWAALVAPIRGRMGRAAKVSMGIGLNFNRLDDTSSDSQTFSGASPLSWLLWSMGVSDARRSSRTPDVDVQGVRDLFTNHINFIGISAYAPYSGPGMTMDEFGNAAFMFADSIKSLGMDLSQLLAKGLQLRYTEFGLGGGRSYSGAQKAASPDQVALRPFFGVYGQYKKADDPWQSSANRAFLRSFYEKLCLWLATPANKTYHISDVYIWSMNSWDVLGMYPESTSPEGSYRDDYIFNRIRQHNLAVRGIEEERGGSAQLG